MADKIISDYPLAGSIDPVADLLLIEQDSPQAYKSINRNILLGITGSPVGNSDTQTLTNKTIGTTNSITQLDNTFTLQDNVDPTKQAQFQLSGISAGTTRVYTLPNASSTLVDLSSTQTLTNKTLTSPTINGGTIDSSTITVDSIAGKSASTSGTIFGMAVTSGAIAAAGIQSNAVTTAKIQDSAVTPAKLLTGTGSSWVWQTWSPSYTNLTVGSGTVSALYIQVGKTVYARWLFVFGAGSSVGTDTTVSLPVTSVNTYNTNTPLGNALFLDTGTALWPGQVLWATTTTIKFVVPNAQGDVRLVPATSTKPMTWAAGDTISATFIYEAA